MVHLYQIIKEISKICSVLYRVIDTMKKIKQKRGMGVMGVMGVMGDFMALNSIIMKDISFE